MSQVLAFCDFFGTFFSPPSSQAKSGFFWEPKCSEDPEGSGRLGDEGPATFCFGAMGALPGRLQHLLRGWGSADTCQLVGRDTLTSWKHPYVPPQPQVHGQAWLIAPPFDGLHGCFAHPAADHFEDISDACIRLSGI